MMASCLKHWFCDFDSVRAAEHMDNTVEDSGPDNEADNINFPTQYNDQNNILQNNLIIYH